MAYRVDNIPLYLKPLFYPYSYLAATSGYLLLLFIRATCRIKISGEEHPPGTQNAIYAIWHENLFPYFIVYVKYNKPYAWMNHPLWFMKPVHIILGFMGLKKLFLGSTGHGGKDALEKVIDCLKQGYNTLLAVDGPAGPYKEMKHGALEMSKRTGIPVIAIQFTLTNYFTLPGWDRKKMPLPFSTIHVKYHQPIFVSEENFEAAKNEIMKNM